MMGIRRACLDAKVILLVSAALGCGGSDGGQQNGETATVNLPTAGVGQAPGVAGARAATGVAGTGATVTMATPGLSTMARAMAAMGAAGAAGTAAAAGGGAAGASAAAGSGGASAAAGSGGAAGHAGASAAAGSGSTAMGGVAPADASTACGEDAQMVMAGMSRKEGYGNTNLRTSGDVEFLSWTGTMVVPKKPAPERGTLFLWPGFQPLQMDQKVGYGVLQPVLTWGTSCADMTNTSYDHWWISGVYVGTTPGSWTNVSCKAGDAMNVEVGDTLDIEMTLNGTIWTQKMTNRGNGKTVSFDYDLKGQKQQWLLHQIEAQGSTKPVDDVIFTNVVAKLSGSQPASCYPSETGANDYFSPPRASADGKTCCFSKIILRAQGAMMTSPNQPQP